MAESEEINEAQDGTGVETADYRVDQQIGFFLRQANQRHVSIFTGMMGDRLTTTQWAALSKLREIQPSSQNQLGRETAMDVATIKGVIDRLVTRGFVQSEADPRDGRRLVLSLTEEGLATIDRNLAIASAVTDETLSPLTSGERMMLIELLRKIC
ncbi:MAG: MarR family transcriptional regulator [Rhizobium sp.]|nr:MarR family transcriptional regulator [Rhizobium sp.]